MNYPKAKDFWVVHVDSTSISLLLVDLSGPYLVQGSPSGLRPPVNP